MSSSVKKPRAKPWESQPLDATTVIDNAIVGPTKSNNIRTENPGEDAVPEIPQRPETLGSDNGNNVRNGLGNQNSFYGQNGGSMNGGFGGSPYGGGLGSIYGAGGGYGSMYGGGYNSMYGGAGGGYGSMMGGYGTGNMYGMGGMGGMGGMNNGGPQSLTESTQATFQLIESLIGAVAGFAQMLEATYMATHNSFFTMVSMAEQISSLKEMLGSIFGIFAAMKMLKRLLYKVSNGKLGSAPRKAISSGPKSKMAKDFEKYQDLEREKRGKRRISWKPLVIFLAAVFGFPFLLRKFIAKLAEIQQRKLGNSGAVTSALPLGLDPRNLEFARAIFDFTPEDPQVEVLLKKGDLMAVISKTDALGRASEWWKVRTKKGDVGYVPYNYLELIRRKAAPAAAAVEQAEDNDQ
ncbi:LANO_0E13014g1_1 [Lachancea nothofagi CBS 11611]|uniref:Peroxisomal membrane protein PEX13 n=1 Tax=Lachancea nothofagi CBS 11611 TaxID=1266666 RepID=A0A1G4JYK1_9SACH|nr:LANO_0E13014g1_1 [Lachancea nothofagi CBS 11611]